MTTKTYEIEPLANAHCATGENPLYDAERRQVFWTDIPNGRLFRLDVVSGEWEKFYDDATVGGFTLQEDGRLLLFRTHEYCLLHEDGRIQIVARDIASAAGRFNDVFADPEGRVFAGTMGENGSGGLYLVERDGSVTHLWSGTNCSNGMGFTPDLKQMYWTDSTAKTVYLFDYERETGSLSNRRVWKAHDPQGGTPDGLTVDREGCVWQAFFRGGCVRRFSPNAELMETIELPVPNVSSVTFGGEEWNELYITTADGKDGSDTEEGTLYRVRVEVQGRPEFRSRIQV